ncbi:MAG: hypothetical protein U9N14_03905 [Pseudomonadota bacterium]|nr:hypothetical protein [Pseudomonadota bacterium]
MSDYINRQKCGTLLYAALDPGENRRFSAGCTNVYRIWPVDINKEVLIKPQMDANKHKYLKCHPREAEGDEAIQGGSYLLIDCFALLVGDEVRTKISF